MGAAGTKERIIERNKYRPTRRVTKRKKIGDVIINADGTVMDVTRNGIEYRRAN